MSFFLTVVVLFPPKVGSLFDKYTLDNLFMICYTGIYAAPVLHCLLLCVDELDVCVTLSSKVLTGLVLGEGVEHGDAFGLVLFLPLFLADEVIDSHFTVDGEVAVHEVFPLLKITTVDNFGHYDSFPLLYELLRNIFF
jgi:hypothetical protein